MSTTEQSIFSVSFTNTNYKPTYFITTLWVILVCLIIDIGNES